MNVLITGGASGLGEALTRALAETPSTHVLFTYHRSEERAHALAKEFPNVTGFKCDFKSNEDLESLKLQMEKFNLDVLINNAYHGLFLSSHFHKIPAEDFFSEFRNNIIPTVTITQTAIQLFRKKKSGKIITILTSALAGNPPIGSSTYVANKAYLEELTKVWAAENIKFNITSNSVSPSFMPTAFTQDIDERMVEQMTESHPLKKLLTPKEVAETVVFLCHASPHLNGVNILLNAGSPIK